MKKGFTLIELLAVIVVLAIIAVIAVPTITNVVNKARIGALKSSAYGLVEAGALYNAQYANDHNARFDISNNVITTTEENKIKYKGNIKRGTVIVSPKGKVTVCITDGKNSVYKNYSENEVTVANKKECSIPANSSIVYLDGEASIDIVDAKTILDEIASLKNQINNMNPSSIKRIFRNTFHVSRGTVTYEITLPYEINPDKSAVTLYGIGVGTDDAEANQGMYVYSLTSTTLTIKATWNSLHDNNYSYQIIEYN